MKTIRVSTVVRDLLDEMLCLFYCSLCPVRAFKKRNGNPGGRASLRGWKFRWEVEIQSGGVKSSCHLLGAYFCLE